VLLYVPPPDLAGREAVLRLHSARVPLAPDVDLTALAAATERFTGAELAALVREAAMAALREDVAGAVCVAARHFDGVLSGASPGLSEAELAIYESWGASYRR
jgi:SpoVK/Ycf46/Vps4 family AAA+-type ATPase